MLKSLDSILHTCVVVIVDLIDIITNRDDSWLGVTLSGAVREQQRCVVSLFTLGATKPSQLCVVCLLISLQCRTPCLIDWGARWRADPSSCHRVVWSLWRQRCGQAAVCQAEVAVLVYMPVQQTHMEEGEPEWPCCLGIMAQVALTHTYCTWHRIGELALLTVALLLPFPLSPSAAPWCCKVLQNYLILNSSLISRSLWLSQPRDGWKMLLHRKCQNIYTLLEINVCRVSLLTSK